MLTITTTITTITEIPRRLHRSDHTQPITNAYIHVSILYMFRCILEVKDKEQKESLCYGIYKYNLILTFTQVGG